ncbi:chitin deacetylase [Phlyctema vagabunda]|uniref:Chitin deacetylase n=1 Tax=Phlyctema vagabunda TaxID=108571 RepID=A0ABR4PD06_9HELO
MWLWKNMISKSIVFAFFIIPGAFSHAPKGVFRTGGQSITKLKTRNVFDTRSTPARSRPHAIERQIGAVPTGISTSSVPRPEIGNVPYGTRINSCTTPGVIALTFDDGPYSYTKDLLDLLDQYNAKATFFITGNNYHDISDCSTEYPALIQRMHNSGHQIASHTWTHPNLNTLSLTDFNNEMYYNEMALRNILGFIPTYMRPPFVDCDSDCFSRLKDLGYHAIYYDIDTFDYANDSPDSIQTSKDLFSNYFAPHPENGLVLSHDIHYETVYNLTKFMLETMAADGYGTSVPLFQLNDVVEGSGNSYLNLSDPNRFVADK